MKTRLELIREEIQKASFDKEGLSVTQKADIVDS